MSGVTNQLVKNYKKINSNIADPEYDVILSTGEQYSSALISTILGKKKINSRSVLGWQIPVETDRNFSKARIFMINRSFFKKQFALYDVLVVAGFQGVTNDSRISTLGRGGSDTSAVAIAYTLCANRKTLKRKSSVYFSLSLNF